MKPAFVTMEVGTENSEVIRPSSCVFWHFGKRLIVQRESCVGGDSG